MPYLLDTDCLIEALAGKPKVVSTIKKLSSYQLAVSLISFGEIYHGAYTYANPQAHIETFRQFTAPFRVLSVNEAIMERFGEVRAVLFRQGKMLSDFDIMIGATALSYNLTVVTFHL